MMPVNASDRTANPSVQGAGQRTGGLAWQGDGPEAGGHGCPGQKAACFAQKLEQHDARLQALQGHQRKPHCYEKTTRVKPQKYWDLGFCD